METFWGKETDEKAGSASGLSAGYNSMININADSFQPDIRVITAARQICLLFRYRRAGSKEMPDTIIVSHSPPGLSHSHAGQSASFPEICVLLTINP